MLRLCHLVPRDERAGAASLALLLWVAGFELAPAMHQAGHAALAPHSHGHAHAHEAEAEGEAPIDEGHGDGSLAHRGLSAASSASPLPPFVAPARVLDTTHTAALEVPHTLSRRPSARGPPIARARFEA